MILLTSLEFCFIYTVGIEAWVMKDVFGCILGRRDHVQSSSNFDIFHVLNSLVEQNPFNPILQKWLKLTRGLLPL